MIGDECGVQGRDDCYRILCVSLLFLISFDLPNAVITATPNETLVVCLSCGEQGSFAR